MSTLAAGSTPSQGSAPSAGIVQPARRPPDWRPPGPPPRPPADAATLGPHAGEDLCWLAGDWRIFQRIDGHRWSLDDLVTAWRAARVAAERPPERFVDLGCGIGTVLLFLAWRFPTAQATGIEAQPGSVGLARRSLAWNGIADRSAVREGDLRDPATLAGLGPVPLVTGTPPYFPAGAATMSRRPQVGPCRTEVRGGIEAYCAAAARLLAPDGAFVVCEAAPQHARVHAAAVHAGLAVTGQQDVVPRAGKHPLFTVFVMRPGPARVPARIAEPLVVRDGAGRRTAAFHALRHEMGLPPAPGVRASDTSVSCA